MAKSVAALLREYGLRPQKSLGQNFLVDPVALQRIVDAADLTTRDTVVEVGAGLGTLTRPLSQRAGCVIAVELDRRLAVILAEQLAGTSGVPPANVEIIQGDILKMDDLGLAHRGYKVVANLPYYITSAVLRHFLEDKPRPELLVVTVQREVAARILAGPGEMSLLAISVQFFGEPRLVTRIPAGAFYPSPQVDSSVLRIDVGQQLRVTLAKGLETSDYFRVVRAGFGQKRKTLRNSLSAGLHIPPDKVEQALRQATVDPRRRAQTLSLVEWAEVTRSLGEEFAGFP
ncbi:MAG: 16S rRNA (adenine(1518)-N(6)/adenine(1519)-N(6))-dimethyltransferase RsmA [Anaerolineae bacterium]|jgi:16S rRNA (adenine1518-N6/adenine1519-N6)-dimethyltransferase